MKSFKQTLCFHRSNKKNFRFSTVIFMGAQNAQIAICSPLSQTHFLPSVCSLLYLLSRRACLTLCCHYNYVLRSLLSIISSLSLLFLSLGLVSYPLPGETNASVWPLSITARPLHHPAPLPPNA